MCCKVSNNLAVYKYNKVFFYRKRLRYATLGFLRHCDKNKGVLLCGNTPLFISVDELITSESSSYHSSQQHPCKPRSPADHRGCR